ncbi:MAG: phenylalanine--tRNA ligase subunit beta [Armatimonadetes bacterium]|nr:phenylalanine--tRNA ligase subunit beta [Armatimonadota bacterium]
MRLSLEWLEQHAPTGMAADEAATTLTMAGLEVEETEESDLGPVLNIKVTPNRGDCLSVIGLAREMAAAARKPFIDVAAAATPDGGEAGDLVQVTIEAPDLCPRYAARVVRNVTIGASPEWMRRRLVAAGMRPINSVVDITNYVMLELGQPLHAFDLPLLRGAAIRVRRSKPGEAITTLDGAERPLAEGLLIIADDERPVAVAGVMGGADTEIGPRTTTILLESAHFDRKAVRRSSKALGLQTEASYRFERIVDPAGVVRALNRACDLIADLGAGTPVDGVVDVYPGAVPVRTVTLRLARVSQMLGFDLSADEVQKSLQALGFDVTECEGEALAVQTPSWRPDVVREIDLIEEVGRVVGYGRMPEKLPSGATTQGGDSDLGRQMTLAREVLVGAGLTEVVGHSLVAATPLDDDGGERVAIRTALSSELSGLRRSLLPGLADVLARSVRRGQPQVALFEVARVFHEAPGGHTETLSVGALLHGAPSTDAWRAADRPAPADYYTVAGLAQALCAAFKTEPPVMRRASDARFHPGRSAEIVVGGEVIGVAGELHPAVAADLDLRERAVALELSLADLVAAGRRTMGFVEPSAFPGVTRDLAPRIASDTPHEAVRQAALDAAPETLEGLALTDVYSGPNLPAGARSLTLSFTFRALDRTLTDDEVETAMAAIRAALERECGATFVA